MTDAERREKARLRSSFRTNVWSDLTNKFDQSGASDSVIKRAYCEETKMSDSTFNRAWRDLLNSGRVRTDGKGRGARYFPVGVSVNSVSGGCHDTAQIGVKSPPL